MNYKQFAEENHIKIRSERIGSRPDGLMDQNMNHWRVTLQRGRQRMTLYYSMGYGLSGEPQVGDVLECLALDASMIDSSRGFEDWCRDLGFNEDSRKVWKMYKVTEKDRDKLYYFLGEGLYDELLWNVQED
jgi:hypothetical protein